MSWLLDSYGGVILFTWNTNRHSFEVACPVAYLYEVIELEDMGAEASKPRPGAQLRVIGAGKSTTCGSRYSQRILLTFVGLPRTGTASFAAALSLLLDGPVYHSGTQLLASNDESHILNQLDVLRRTPYESNEDKAFAMKKLKTLTNGYVGVADSPFGQLVAELVELYPDAIVICTIREPEAWAKSMGNLVSTSVQSLLRIILWWVPCARHFPEWVEVLNAGIWGELYFRPGEGRSYDRRTWDRHVSYLKRVVPEEKLFFCDVRDGWEPLCKALKINVPDAVEFPRINDGAAMDAFASKLIVRGLLRWAIAAALLTSLSSIAYQLWY